MATNKHTEQTLREALARECGYTDIYANLVVDRLTRLLRTIPEQLDSVYRGEAVIVPVEPGCCPVCDWPFAVSREHGCVPGDCSYRPTEGTEEYRWIEKRRAAIKAAADCELHNLHCRYPDEADELRSNAESVSAEFEGDCWKAMRSLLAECHLDWADYGVDGIAADDAREHVAATLTALEEGQEFHHAHARKYEADNARLRAALEQWGDALLDIRARIGDEGDRCYFGSTNDADALRDMAREFEDMRWEAYKARAADATLAQEASDAPAQGEGA